MTLEFEAHPFWDFSLKVYSTEGVGEACLKLQERRNIDVNVILFCAFNGASGRGALDSKELEAALAAVKEWNAGVVCGLRVVRQRLKGGIEPIPKDLSDALRRRILKLEIDCEHAEQLALARSVDRQARAEDAAVNVTAYFRSHGFAPDAEDIAAMARILDAAVPEVDLAEMEKICRRVSEK
jgi:uncharacterized protein (TIGR02444 family)